MNGDELVVSNLIPGQDVSYLVDGSASVHSLPTAALLPFMLEDTHVQSVMKIILPMKMNRAIITSPLFPIWDDVLICSQPG